MDIQDLFETFYENIKITSSQREDAQTKYTGVCKKLHGYYYPDSPYDGRTKLLIGSYAKKTHIRPARDVDVIFKMPVERFEQYNDNHSNGQSQLLQDVKKVLEEKYPNTPIRAFGKVIVVEFSDTKHNVELLPAWENEDGTFNIPNSENGGSWEEWE
ncbi:MAG TPA: nucleotidyltransferase, partial [Phycisphaerales bacterium]|nr:nucleotidyltransferase [Phycisphaerales bacterium]